MISHDPWYEDAACVLAQMGYGPTEIAGMIKVHANTVARMLLRNGLTKPRAATGWSKKEDDFVVKLRREGKGLLEIAVKLKDKFGRSITERAISDRILRIEAAEECDIAASKRPREEQIAAEYRAGGISTYRLSVKHGMKDANVRKILRKRGLLRTVRRYINNKDAFTPVEDRAIEEKKARGWSNQKIAIHLNNKFRTKRSRYAVRDRVLTLQTSEAAP